MSVQSISSSVAYQATQQIAQSTSGAKVEKGGGGHHHHKQVSGVAQTQQTGITQSPQNILASAIAGASNTGTASNSTANSSGGFSTTA